MGMLRDYGPLGFARMAGSSIAARGAAPWVTDFLNAAYYRRPGADVDDLRLAFCVLTTYWWRSGRLHATDLRAFHRAYYAGRRSQHGTLDRAALLAGAADLLGAWFPTAYEDCRGWGIAFPDAAARAAYVPEARLRHARLGRLIPPVRERQVTHTYPPVALPSARAALALLESPDRWPDFASALGRFTPLRSTGLLGQTFEIEVAAGTGHGLPVFTRGYVTCTAVVGPETPEWFARLGIPGEPIAGVELTTHQGHFLGAARSQLALYADAGREWIRDVGTWDRLPPHVAVAYRLGGRAAQHAFWGGDGAAGASMLQQLAAVSSAAR